MRLLLTRATKALMAVVVLYSTAISQYRGSLPVPRKWNPGFRSIKVEDAREILGALAGPDFRGRSPRTGDYAAAAGYTSALLRQWRLRPLGEEGSFFQRFMTETVSALPEATTFVSADATMRLDFMKDFSLRVFADFESAERIAFLRVPKGTDTSKLDLSEYPGRIVIVRPEMVTENRDVYRDFVAKWAALGGTRPVLPLARPELLRSGLVNRVKGIPPATADKFSTFSLTDAAARKLAEYCGAQNYLAESATAATIESCPQDFRLQSKVTVKDDLASFNVLAKIEGSDPVLSQEYVVIGAHLDHFGATDRSVRWGADDNASGVTAALLIARAIQQNPVKPRRSVIIGLWAMEEGGLLGSWNYVNRVPVPIEKTIAYLNMDQVGRNEEDPRFREKADENTTSVYLGSVKFNSEELYQLLRRTNAFVNLRLKPDQEDRTLRSDTASFYRKNIPTLKAFTGEHPDYHRDTDTADKINYPKLVNIAKWLYISTMELASQAERPRYQKFPFAPWAMEESNRVRAVKRGSR